MTTTAVGSTNGMTINIADISQRNAVIFAGIGFLLSFVGAIAASLFINIGNAAASTNNLMFGVLGFLIAILGDVLRAWALYVFFKPVNKSLALLSAWFMLLHDAIFGAALLNLVFGSMLLSGADYLAIFATDQLQALRSLFLNGFNVGFEIGLFFFSFHLGLLGYLVYRSGFIPKLLSILLIAASLGYLIDSVGNVFLPNYPEIIGQILMAPNFIGEVALIVWLVFRGVKAQPRHEHAFEPA